MKVCTVVGTRPELIRLSRIIPVLDELCDHTLIHTGQNWDPGLKDVFFEELGIRNPDFYLEASSPGLSFHAQVAAILDRCGEILEDVLPDRLLVLGDTNSALSAFVAKRFGIPVYHMEAGNRCYDDRVPEEVNRRVIDSCSDVLMPYTENSRRNLLAEGYPGHRIQVTGNPIYEVLEHYSNGVESSGVLDRLGLDKGSYFLVTAHREENVDVQDRLKKIVRALDLVAREFNDPVVVSVHPRTRARLDRLDNLSFDSMVRWLDPLGFFDFVHLEQNAHCVLSDSGTVQEECCILHTPSVTLRDTTERPETVECGSNILAGVDPDRVLNAVYVAISREPDWGYPDGYVTPYVSNTVAKIVLGHRI